MKRTNFDVSLVFNGLRITEVIIDQHYRVNHPDMSDDIILELIKKLHRLNLKPTAIKGEFSYYVVQPLYWNERPYRIIVMLEQRCQYIGVINAFRIKEN